MDPRRLIQTGKSVHMRGEPMLATLRHNTIRSHNTIRNARYMFFNDDQMERLFHQMYPEYVDTYRSFEYRIQQIDFFKYVAVYHYGGLYYDLDMYVHEPFDDFHPTQAIFPIEFMKSSDTILHAQGEQRLLGNYAFYAPPRHPFIKAIIDNIVRPRIAPESLPCDKHARVYYTTGPVLVTQTYVDFTKARPDHRDLVRLLQPTPFRPCVFGEYASHLMAGTWKRA